MLSKIPLINRIFRFPRNSGFCTYDTYCVLAFHGSIELGHRPEIGAPAVIPAKLFSLPRYSGVL